LEVEPIRFRGGGSMSAMPEFVPTQPTLISSPELQPRRSCRSGSGARAECYIRSICLAVAVTTLLAFWIGGYVQMTVRGYELKRLQTRLACVQESNRALSEQVDQLGSLSRVVPDARRLSMVPVIPSQTIQIDSTDLKLAPAKSLRLSAPTTVALVASTDHWGE
ncbi:MAG: hypothetical protein M3Y56_04545, partial [Armatimonadota bacterium]|nr:hypothetical protein [Armatimonadota bacterium]